MDISVETAVNRVIVYPDRARVTVAGSCELETGSHRLLVGDLPLVLEPESVRVVGRGTARVRILGVDVPRRFYQETPAARVNELEREIEQVQDEIQVLKDEAAGWAAHNTYLTGLREATVEYARGFSRGKTTVADQTQLVSFLQEQDRLMRAAERELNKSMRERKRQLQKLENELKQLRSARPRERYQAQIEIDVQAAGTFRPQVSYVVHRAGWQPLYDVRLVKGDNGRALEISYLAQITQQTGQDWAGVNLSVSTARPALNQRLPELHPWFVDVYQPPPQPRMVRAAAPAAAMQVGGVEAEEQALVFSADAMVEEAAEVATAVASNEGTSVTFHVSDSADIPSDGSPHKNVLQEFNLDPKLDYLSIPKHTSSVYRRATVTNTSPGPLLAGAASLFVADEFIGRTQLDYTPVNGEIELLLGVEEGITVERELSKRDVDKKMLRDERRIRYGYKIELENLLPEAANVEVHDHIPVGRVEQIKIKLDQCRPALAEQTDLNLLEWQLILPSKGKQEIHYEFLVEYPRSLRITGLPD